MGTDEERDPLLNAVDTVELAARLLAVRAEWEQENRRGLLWVHACVAVWCGVQMYVFGSAPTIEAAVGLWTRGVMGTLALVGGLALAAGLKARPRSIPREVFGLTAIAIWDLAMTGGLIYARLHQGDFRPIPWNEPLRPGYVVGYAPGVYAGYLALLSVHLWTLRRMRHLGRGHGRHR